MISAPEDLGKSVIRKNFEETIVQLWTQRVQNSVQVRDFFFSFLDTMRDIYWSFVKLRYKKV